MRSPHDILIGKLSTRGPLIEEDVAALKRVPIETRELAPHSYLVREGMLPSRCAFIVGGFAYRQKLAASGGRQIVGFMIPGDFTDLQQLFLTEADHNVQALTRLTVAELATSDLQKLAMNQPGISRALWVDVLIEGSITRENMLNIGRRDGPTRVAHLFCEFEARLSAAGLAQQGYDLPMTQEQMGDVLALTSVHVNRTLRQLTGEGLISRAKRFVRIEDWPGLQRRAEFNSSYLHLDQISGASRFA